jgi:lysozyme family protein
MTQPEIAILLIGLVLIATGLLAWAIRNWPAGPNEWEQAMAMTIDDIIEEIMRAEGGYVDDPADRGGETNYGITIATARANGWAGPMRELPRAFAMMIYRRQYVEAPGFDKVIPLSAAIAAELVDTGVNMGPATAGRFLQRTLNALNRNGTDWGDIATDGIVGAGTVAALRSAMLKRGKADGERVILRALNALQGARYIELAEGRAANEKFVFGWLDKRVA